MDLMCPIIIKKKLKQWKWRDLFSYASLVSDKKDQRLINSMTFIILMDE